MNQKQIKAAVEAMLFAAGDPVSADKLAAAVQLPQTAVETALEDLRARYAREDSGLCLLHLDTRWQLATKTEWADCVRRLLAESEKHEITYHWLKGHAGHPENERCDRMAVEQSKKYGGRQD